MPFGAWLRRVLRLLLADAPIVIGEIQVDVGFQNQPVVADDRDGPLLRGFDNFSCRLRVVRDNHQRLHAPLQQ